MKIFELVIDENVEDESGVDFISLVDSPATQSYWHSFRKQKYEDTFNDYPESASNNAARGLRYIKEYGEQINCNYTRVGLARARQLANKENISWETISRMASFNRHKQNAKVSVENKNTPYKDCGHLAWLLWGGTSGVNWAIEKMKTKDKFSHSFKVQDEEKRIVSGYFMIADLPIARMDDNGKMFYVVFRKNTIEKIVNKFMKNGYNTNVNIMHDGNKMANGVYIIESLIVDSKRGIKAPKGFENAPDGSWWGSMRVENDEIWEQVKKGEFKGFSVEGMFGQEKDIDLPNKVIEKIRQVIKKYRANKKKSFVSMVVSDDLAIIDDRLAYSTQEKAEEMARNIGCKGFHTHEFEGKTWFMPCEKHVNDQMYKKKCPKGYKKKYGKCVKMAEVGERGGIRKSPKAPKSKTPNKNPKGEGSAKGSAKTSRGAKVSKEDEKTLQKKSDDFNERYKEKLGYGVTVGQLKTVFQRGLGAYNTSHSPNVTSAKQWGLARVNAYLYLVKNGRPQNPKYTTDYDLLPSKHPKSKK